MSTSLNTVTMKKPFARFINAIALAGAAYLLWQAFRFCMGEVGAPIIDQLNLANVSGAHFDINEPDTLFFYPLRTIGYYVGGVGVWVWLASVVIFTGNAIARIVEVGFAQYWAEEQAAHAESKRLAALDKRRSLRRMARQRKSQVGLGVFLLGLMLGALWF